MTNENNQLQKYEGDITVVKPTRDVGQIATMVAQAEGAGWNTLVPASLIDTVPEGFRMVARTLKFSSRDFYKTGSKKVYNGRRSDWVKVYAPHKRALEQIAAAAGIKWHPMMTGRTDDRSHPHYAEFRAVGIVRDPQTGEHSPHTATYALDLRDGSAQVKEILTRQDDVEKAKKELRQKRRFIVQLADTGARLRVIRSAYPVRSDYTKEEMERPFLLVSLVYLPDDPEARRQAQIAAAQSSQALFGSMMNPQGGSSPWGMNQTQIGGTTPPALEEESEPEDDAAVDAEFEAAIEEGEGPLFGDEEEENPASRWEIRPLEDFRAAPREEQLAMAKIGIATVEYPYAQKVAEAGHKGKEVDDLSPAALDRLYRTLVERSQELQNTRPFDDDDIPFG